MSDYTIVENYVGRHPCHLPGLRERRRALITLGTVIECQECHQRWKWDDYGWDDVWKEWRRCD
jgi:hypothetical protein